MILRSRLIIKINGWADNAEAAYAEAVETANRHRINRPRIVVGGDVRHTIPPHTVPWEMAGMKGGRP